MAHALSMNAYALSAAQPGPFARLRERLATYLEFARIRDELDALSDRELADIGLSRSDIPAVARKAAYVG